MTTSETISDGRPERVRAIRRPTPRTKVALAAVAAMIAMAAISMPLPAKAGGYTPGCSTATKSWKVKEGSVWVVIGHVHGWVKKCWNSHGYLTSTNAGAYSDLTKPGWSTGWSINTHRTVLVRSSAASAYYRTPGDANVCQFFRIGLCGFTEDFEVTAAAHAPNQYGPFPPTFGIRCTNSHCKLRFS